MGTAMNNSYLWIDDSGAGTPATIRLSDWLARPTRSAKM